MLYYKICLLSLVYFTTIAHTVTTIAHTVTTTVPTTTLNNNYNFFNKYYYKKVGLDNEIYRCGMDSVCIIETPIYNSYDNITNCEEKCNNIDL